MSHMHMLIHRDTPRTQLEELSEIRGFVNTGLSGVCVCVCRQKEHVCVCACSKVLHLLGNNIPANDRFSRRGGCRVE